MRWLSSKFSSSSKSESRSESGNSEINSLFSRLALGSNHRQSSRQRRLTRSKKLRHLSDDVVSPHLYRSTSAGSSLASSPSGGPQPLPLPELNVLLRRDAATLNSNKSNSDTGNFPLPSPKAASRVGAGVKADKRKLDAFNVDSSRDCVLSLSPIGSRHVLQDTQSSMEHSEISLPRKSLQEHNKGKGNQGKYKIDIPSAPTSPYSCPGPSPRHSLGEISFPCYMSHMTPQGFQGWPSSDMAPMDATLSPDHLFQMNLEKANIGIDSSPFHSPLESPRKSTRSPSGHVPQPFVDTSTTKHESHVHPLPLPPKPGIQGATTPQPAPVPTLSPKPDIFPVKNQWQKGKLIGRGTFGAVYVASNRETGALCAMKEVEILPDDSKSAEREIKVLSRLKHPNIVQYYGSEIIGDHFYIYLEYVHPGSISRYISDHCGAMTESVVRNFTRHILCGLAYLHSTKTIHRDIKGANLLVDASGVVKLADFGMAKHLTGQAAANLSLKGSPYWMAPELLQSEMQKDASSDLALAVDIWSLGCTIIEMMNGKPPWSEYEGAAALFKVLKEIPPIPETLSPDGKDFLQCCFRRNPAERPSASRLLEHQFVKNLQQEKEQTQREHLNHKLDLLPSSSDAHSTKGNLACLETGCGPHHRISHLTLVSHPSPCFSLEAHLSLSPPGLSQSADHPMPSAYLNCI